MKGLTIEVFQSIHGTWAWRIFKDLDGIKQEIPYRTNSGGYMDCMHEFSGTEKTLAKATEAAAKQYGRIAVYYLTGDLRQAYRDARPVVRITT